jgi:hypothetical protein
MEIKGYHFRFRKKPNLPGYLATIAPIPVKCGAPFCFFDSGLIPLRFFPDFCARVMITQKTLQIRAFPHHTFKNLVFMITGSYHGQEYRKKKPDAFLGGLKIRAFVTIPDPVIRCINEETHVI